ncbi:MAG: PAS domain-containing sensor histidine kinase [Alphaproteobacteria bacterium]|nr:PAS domain-containing sensor histidine kinase [Alphaproteobacteria bacterium]
MTETAEQPLTAKTGGLGRLLSVLDRPKVSRTLTVLVGLATLAAGAATYYVFSGAGAGLERDPEQLVTLIYVDLVVLLLLGVIVARRLARLWTERRQGAAGARMHVRLVALFGALSIAPAIVVAGFSLLFFNFGLESWFSDRVRTAVQSSSAIAEAYLEEHTRNIEADALWVAGAVNRDAPLYVTNPRLLERRLNIHANLRQLPEALIFEEGGQILARAGLTIALEFEPISSQSLQRARSGDVVILRADGDERVRALVRLESILDTFLIVGQIIDPVVLGDVARTQGAVQEYVRLETERSQFQISFALAFVMVALLLLLTAVWFGLNVATGLSAPISRLIAATEQVRGGDLSTQVVPSERDDEIDLLGRAFNRMTQQLLTQRNDLLFATDQAEARRRFTETVLTGVSAGVIGLDQEGQIDLPNTRASELLGVDLDQRLGQSLASVVPEMAELVGRARAGGQIGFIEQEVQIGSQSAGRTLFVRIGPLRQAGAVSGYVVTFDDLTALASAQRTAAWADVARRIAHEIKNPLTPIQLSAERLKRKYLRDIENDPQVFETCVDTIIRQVGDIGQMVDEFSSFAKMPSPTIQIVDLSDLCRQQVFLQQNGNPGIDYSLSAPEEAVEVACDSRQIAQVLTNILKNAQEAIDGARQSGVDEKRRGAINLDLTVTPEATVITVSDNGKGLPRENRNALTEPYVTTREKGTGLGLAIVKKIMEDHGGALVLGDNPSGGGAAIRLVLPPPGAQVQTVNTDAQLGAADVA